MLKLSPESPVSLITKIKKKLSKNSRGQCLKRKNLIWFNCAPQGNAERANRDQLVHYKKKYQ